MCRIQAREKIHSSTTCYSWSAKVAGVEKIWWLNIMMKQKMYLLKAFYVIRREQEESFSRFTCKARLWCSTCCSCDDSWSKSMVVPSSQERRSFTLTKSDPWKTPSTISKWAISLLFDINIGLRWLPSVWFNSDGNLSETPLSETWLML